MLETNRLDRSTGNTYKGSQPAERPRRRARSSRHDGIRDRQDVAARLVRRCADGDHAALTELHDLFSARLLWQVRGIVRNPEEAEEVVQEVFLYAWQRADRYDSRRAAVSTWLGQIARSRAIDHLRKAGLLERTRTRVASEGVSKVESRTEHDIHVRQWRQRLHRALEGLPAAQRQTVVLAYYGDMTQREIAARIQIPLGTVKTRTFLALRKLREELAVERV